MYFILQFDCVLLSKSCIANPQFLLYCRQVHHVLIPEVEIQRRLPRRSLVLFVDPDLRTLITSLDGSNNSRYPPITAKEWLKGELNATYHY